MRIPFILHGKVLLMGVSLVGFTIWSIHDVFFEVFFHWSM